MSINQRLLLLMTALFMVAAAISLGQHVAAQGSGGFAIPWYTIDGGGGQSQGARFTITGTIGQPDPGYSSDGDFSFHGGFWGWLSSLEIQNLYLPMLLKD